MSKPCLSAIVVMQTVKILMVVIHVNVNMDLKVMVKSVLRLTNVLLEAVCQTVMLQALTALTLLDHLIVNVLMDMLVMVKHAMISMNV